MEVRIKRQPGGDWQQVKLTDRGRAGWVEVQAGNDVFWVPFDQVHEDDIQAIYDSFRPEQHSQ